MYEKYRKASDHTETSICFIFGAGASYGYSSEEVSYIPPVVVDLFNDKNLIVKEVIRRPEHSFILGHRDFLIRALKRYNDDLEQYLSALYNKNDNDDLFSSLLTYLQDIFYLASDRIEENNNNYKNLINQLFTSRGKLPWSCISFNYDTLLEQSYIFAQRDRSRNFESLESYLANPKILKMHGSVNFRYLLTEARGEYAKTDKEIFGLMMDGKKDIGEELRIFNPRVTSDKNPPFYNPTTKYDKEGINRAVDIYNFPLMMIPIHGTKRSENELFIEMLAQAKTEIEKAHLIVAIGYNFGDELFTQQLEAMDLSKKELILVGTKKLALDYKNLTAYKNIVKIFKGQVRVFDGNGFTDFLEAII